MDPNVPTISNDMLAVQRLAQIAAQRTGATVRFPHCSDFSCTAIFVHPKRGSARAILRTTSGQFQDPKGNWFKLVNLQRQLDARWDRNSQIQAEEDEQAEQDAADKREFDAFVAEVNAQGVTSTEVRTITIDKLAPAGQRTVRYRTGSFKAEFTVTSAHGLVKIVKALDAIHHLS